MLEIPEVAYARNGDVSIAYQVVGAADVDLVYVPGWLSHIDRHWESPPYARFLRRLASFSRLIIVDRRGIGLSDRTGGELTVEEQVDDVLTVLDDVGARSPSLFGTHEGATIGCVLAASHPGRLRSLAIYGARPRFLRAPDYPNGLPEHLLDELVAANFAGWGMTEPCEHMRSVQPSISDAAHWRWWMLMARSAASPGTARDLMRFYARIDIRAILPVVRVPTLSLSRTGDLFTPPEHGRYTADRIPGARYVELPGNDTFIPGGDLDSFADVLEEFVTGTRRQEEGDRILATVLFTDLVDSTKQAAALGDRRWTEVLDEHDRVVQREVERFRGRVVKSTGDGVLATFDGPARGVQCAVAINEGLRPLGLHVRAGLHTGEVEVRGDDIGGLAVHIGARIMAKSAPGQTLVSSTVKDLVVGSRLQFRFHSESELKGVPGEWRMFTVEEGAAPS